MRKLLIYIFVLCCFMPAAASAQEATLLLPGNSGETLVLNCDREIYGVSEQIQYFASYEAPEAVKSSSWSKIIYVELISWDGTKQAASKVLLENKGARGSIEIPDNIPSGVYYLRAYTLWMRNYSPYSYSYLPLRILNPYSQEVLAQPAEGDTRHHSLDQLSEIQTEGIVFSGMKDSYGSGEQVEIEIQMPPDLRSGQYSLGVAKTPGSSSVNHALEKKIKADNEPVNIEFLPEINGLTLSGTLIDSENRVPVADAKLQLSSYADPFFYAEVFSGKDGSFLFTLPHFTGNPELHIAEATEIHSNHNILLASEFCNKPIELPYVPLLIDTLEQTTVREILVNTQLKERYGLDPLPFREGDKQNIPFYGEGASVTYVNDYIELSDLREFIYEIIPLVSISSSSSGSSISIQGPSCMDIYPPLILVDNVPVANNEEVLNITSNRIERIEVINQAYLVGNSRYSGILSVYSAKKDMTGMNREGERHFFNLRLLDEKYRLQADEPSPLESSVPDVRNLLFWDPETELSGEGSCSVRFTTPDVPGNYVLTLRGTDPHKGSPVFRKALISVK